MVSLGDEGMSDLPDWLHELILIEPWTVETFDILYTIFENDFKVSRPKIDGVDIWFFPEKEDGKETIFGHLTQRKDLKSGERLPDFRRCERLRWVRCIIENEAKPEIQRWDYIEADKSTHTYLWLKNWDFVVILKKYPNGERRLLTSFWVEFESTKRNFNSKYEKRVK
jgi:hypothetical protein